jgi:hypothetical protein
VGDWLIANRMGLGRITTVAVALSNTRSSEPSGSDVSVIPAVADAMNRQSTMRPSVRNKARLWFL